MTIKELLKLLVETEDLDTRMSLVEENSSLFEEAGTDTTSEELVALQTELETLRQELAEQKQKYRDRFFSGASEESEESEEAEEESEDEEVKSLDEILKGGK